MTQTLQPELFDKQVRRYVYDYFVQRRQAPTVLQCAQALACDVSRMQAAFRRLAEGKAPEEIATLWAELGFTSPFWDLNP